MAKKRTTASAKAITKDAMSKEIKSVLFLGAGVVLGSMGGSMVDKVLKVDHTDTRMNLKKFIRPLVLVGAGTLGGIKLTDDNMKNIAKGVVMSGILSGVKVILRKDLLAGLEGFQGLGDTAYYDAYGEPIGDISNASVYYEPDDAIAMLPPGSAVEGYDPILPQLEARSIAYDNQEIPQINSLESAELAEFELI